MYALSRIDYDSCSLHAQVVKWYTRTLEVRMPKGVEVQVLLAAPMRDRLMVGHHSLEVSILGSIPSPATKLFFN